MEYREIGKTGCRASIIGLGCEHLDGKPFAQVNETVSDSLGCLSPRLVRAEREMRLCVPSGPDFVKAKFPPR